MLLFTILCCAIINFIICQGDSPQVTTPLGKIKGSILTTVGGKPIYSFRGIRYAKPPINELRFQPPVPIESWDDVYDATKDGSMCPQPRLSPTSEDCLFINVYTTKLPDGGENPKRPVIVFFHFGGYAACSGSSAWVGPQYLLDEDIVLVTMNYRLGALGFISTGDELAPGNYGMKDQVLSLKWVKDNIASFGGDPNLVTISGSSVGGASVTQHMVSSMSIGLFNRAIVMGAAGTGNWPIKPNFKLAQRQAKILGCPYDTSVDIINCLKTTPAQKIGDSYEDLKEFGIDPILVWHSVIEPDYGQERFLIEDPSNTIECGEFINVPVMAALTKDEFAHFGLMLQMNNTLWEKMMSNFEEIAPISFFYKRTADNLSYISSELKKWAIDKNTSVDSLIDAIGTLYADSIIGFSLNRFVKLMARKNNEPVYYGSVTNQGRYSHFYKPGTTTPFGVIHRDDILYVFYISTLFPKFNESDPEYAIVKKMTSMWANFAKTGYCRCHNCYVLVLMFRKPLPALNAELDNVDWTPFSLKDNNYLEIDEKLVMKKNLFKDRYDLWAKLFPLPQC